MKRTAQMIFGRNRGTSLNTASQVDGEVVAQEVKASLDLGTEATNLDTIIEATSAGADGNSITFTSVHDAGAPDAGELTRTGTAFTYTYKGGTTTVADFEAAVAALAGADDLIGVKTAGTGANVLADTDDEMAAEPLAGGVTGNEPRRVFSTSQGGDAQGAWSVHLICSAGLTGTVKFYYSNLPFPDPDTAAHWVEDTDKDFALAGSAVNAFVTGIDKPADHIMVEVTLSAGSGTIVGWAR
jgi:hypothetical protein